jgi:hypothetical protein
MRSRSSLSLAGVKSELASLLGVGERPEAREAGIMDGLGKKRGNDVASRLATFNATVLSLPFFLSFLRGDD